MVRGEELVPKKGSGRSSLTVVPMMGEDEPPPEAGSRVSSSMVVGGEEPVPQSGDGGSPPTLVRGEELIPKNGVGRPSPTGVPMMGEDELLPEAGARVSSSMVVARRCLVILVNIVHLKKRTAYGKLGRTVGNIVPLEETTKHIMIL